MNLPASNCFPTFFSAARTYFHSGYSVIPLYGGADPSRPKVAAVGWGGYQKSKATLDQLQKWFLEDRFAGIGIVTGEVSRLAVLDFDTPEGFNRFRARFPALTETRIVRTRRGCHLYFRLPSSLRPPSCKGAGIDFLSNGCYVVAPPTVIDGHVYEIVQDKPVRVLSAYDVLDIHGFMGEMSVASVSNLTPRPRLHRVERGSRAEYGGGEVEVDALSQAGALSDGVVAVRSVAVEARFHQTDTGLVALYDGLVGNGERRNQALFRAGLAARDGGWSVDQTMELLVGIHVHQPAVGQHRAETPEARCREAIRTVESVFSRLPRPVRLRSVQSDGLPNTVREALLGQGCAAVVRVWEGLRLKGVKPGVVFTVGEALVLLEGMVGRDSIYGALKMLISDGKPIFEQVIPPNPPQAHAAIDSDTNHQNKCYFGRAEKSGIIRRGRKTRYFVMPTTLDLCRKLNVRPTFSDPLTVNEISSSKQTRMAVHREFIKRRPGIYPRRWLAKRLGVCLETLDTYNDEAGISSRHQYQQTRILWSNLKCVPDDVLIDGAFLEDETGKRYPAQRAVAAKLLKAGKSVTYKRQDANYYWYGATPPDLGVLYGLRPERNDAATDQPPEAKARARQHLAPTGKPGQGNTLPLQGLEANTAQSSIEIDGDKSKSSPLKNAAYIEKAPMNPYPPGPLSPYTEKGGVRLTVRDDSSSRIVENLQGDVTRLYSPLGCATEGCVASGFDRESQPPMGVETLCAGSLDQDGQTGYRAAPEGKAPDEKVKRQLSGQRPLSNEALEGLACRVYERINALSSDPKLHISMAVSRRLVGGYGRDLIEEALKLLQQRRNIAKPAGFFITVLRSEAKRGSFEGRYPNLSR